MVLVAIGGKSGFLAYGCDRKSHAFLVAEGSPVPTVCPWCGNLGVVQ